MESEATWSGPWSRRASHGASQPFHGASQRGRRSRLASRWPTASLLAALVLACLSSCQAAIGKAGQRQPPHIVLILADDMGWNDVGFHGSDEIPTPNIDALAYNGLILNQHYTPSLCTPSRAALLTGKYPIHTGMQHLVILESEPWGLGLGEVLLPEVLSAAGYTSHAVGKWHLGFYRADYTPIRRGFASHYGYWQGFHDYYNHSVKATYEPFDGYDMRRGLETDWSAMGKYSTDLFTEEAVRLISEHDKAVPLFLYLAHLAPHTGNMRDPFQAPDDVIAKFSHIQDPERRVYAAMVSKLDESVGEVVSALRENGMLDNSIIIFLSDNGAPTHGIHSNRGSNYPLRGMKNSAWEGGNRGVAAVWSPLLKKNQRVANQLMYITDWLPTLSSIAGIDLESVRNLDGVDMWEALSEDKPSPRTEIVYNIDNVESEYTFPYAAVRKNEWKYVTGSSTGERNNAWYGELPEDSDIGYDLKSILLSKTGAAISAFIIKEQIKEKIQKATAQNSIVAEKEGRDWRLLTERKMKQLRESAKVVCSQNQTEIPCNPLLEPCLFNVETDPCERVNLASHHLHILADMEQLLARYEEGMVKARNVGGDLRADPTLWNNTWSPWYDELERAEEASRFYETLSGFIYTSAFILLAVGLVAALPWASPAPRLKSRTLSIFTIEGFLSPKSNGSLSQKEKKSPD